MCGIAGFVDARRATAADELAATAAAMAGTVHHRGPDDRGVWVDAESGVALGHQRLSIVDLSAAGHQPMTSADGRFVLTYNGETYDHPRLRTLLEADGARFRGRSDTEVVVEAIGRWGLARALGEMNGMFALAVWDTRERRLFLARDRMGEKPLYYGWIGDTFVFGSELKALRAHPRFKAEISRDAVASFMRLNCVPAPYTIYDGVAKVRPGEVVEVDPDARSSSSSPYWSVVDAARRGAADPITDPRVAVDLLGSLLADAVAMRMVADVPVGAFLSGGVDSSLIVALAQRSRAGAVRTFTIGFDEGGFDEADHAHAVAAHLGTDHTELYLSPDAALEIVPQLPAMYDEPFADSSQLPTHLVARLARQHVTVSVSGDGGDELFSGYTRYQLFRRMLERLRGLPVPVRSVAARAITSRSPAWWSARARSLPSRFRPQRAGEKLHKLALVLGAGGEQAAYAVTLSQWQRPLDVVPGAHEPRTALDDPAAWLAELPRAARPRLVDQLLYLPDDILVKVDRATMAVSLEARVPLLDHRVVELAWRMPPEVLHHDGRGKWPLRELLGREVPTALFDRPKQGFGVPISAWLRGPLRGWAEELLSTERLRDAGLLDVAAVRAVWAEHLARDDDWAGGYDLWTVLMLQAWLAQ